MTKKIINCLRRDFIVSKKVVLLSIIVVLVMNVVALVVEPDSSTMSLVKAIIVSSMILNVAAINYGFKQEESPGYKYIMAMSDINIKIQILARFILFLLIPVFILIIYWVFNIPILIYIFAGVLVTSGLALFVYYLLGSPFISFPFLFLFVLIYSITSSNIQINLSFIQIVVFSLLIYILILLITILCEKMGWNIYSKIPEN